MWQMFLMPAPHPFGSFFYSATAMVDSKEQMVIILPQVSSTDLCFCLKPFFKESDVSSPICRLNPKVWCCQHHTNPQPVSKPIDKCPGPSSPLFLSGPSSKAFISVSQRFQQNFSNVPQVGFSIFPALLSCINY